MKGHGGVALLDWTRSSRRRSSQQIFSLFRGKTSERVQSKSLTKLDARGQGNLLSHNAREREVSGVGEEEEEQGGEGHAGRERKDAA